MTEFNIFEDSPAEPTLPAGQDKEIDMTTKNQVDLGGAAAFDSKLVKASVDLPEVVPVGALIETAQIQLSEWVGQRKLSAALRKLLTVCDLIELQKIKESKAYKGLRVVFNEKLLTVSTFDELCTAIGESEGHINEQLLNLRTFGPEWMEFVGQSIGYRGLRSLRKLPDDEKTALIEAAKSGDKEQLVDLAELLIEKHINEKAELVTKTKLLEADMDDERKRTERIEKQLVDAETRLETSELTLKMATRGEGLALVTRNIRAESMANASLIGYACDEIARQWELAESEAALNEADKTARERAVLMGVSAALEAVIVLYEAIRERTSQTMPLLPSALDDLTNDERQSAIDSLERVKEQFVLRTAEKKHEAYGDHVADGGDRRRGRPTGSKNRQ